MIEPIDVFVLAVCQVVGGGTKKTKKEKERRKKKERANEANGKRQGEVGHAKCHLGGILSLFVLKRKSDKK